MMAEEEEEAERRKRGERPKSEWAVADRLGRMDIAGPEAAEAGGGGHVILATEAERIVENLRRFKLEDVGTAAWMAQHAEVEKLNQQAHASARDKMDEFVLEALLTFEKLDVLVYDLVLIEAWREHVLPLLFDDIADDTRRTKAMRAYFVLYHEATVVNLLECVCYHAHVVAALKDTSLDVVDYCARRLATLHGRCGEFRESSLARHQEPGQSAAAFARDLEARTAKAELEQHMRDIEFACSVSCVALTRFICEHVGDLSVSALSRVLSKHDLMLSVVPLLENPPWTRCRKQVVVEEDGKEHQRRCWQKLVDGEWKTVAHDRLLDVTKVEAQVWLALYHLAMHPEVRRRYGFDAFRKQTLLRSRRFLTPTLLDQIPLLAELQRFMDELVLVDAPEPTALEQSTHLLMEQVAAQRELALRGADFNAVAQVQRDTLWGPTVGQGTDDADLTRLVDLYAGDDHHNDDGEDRNATLDLDALAAAVDLEHRGGASVFRDEVRVRDNRSGATCFGVPPETSTGGDGAAAAASLSTTKRVDTNVGPFDRAKWTCADGIVVDAESALSVEVSQWATAEVATLLSSEALPATFDPPPKAKVWRQFGAVEEGLTVQLRLVLEPRGAHDTSPRYKITEIFVATQVANDPS